jgi:ATP:ADP antiporter, AAA family
MTPRPASLPASAAPLRALVLFINFFLVILAYYLVKPASRSLFIEYVGAGNLPWVWIATALTLGAIIGGYHRLVAGHSRLRVVIGTHIACLLGLLVFNRLLEATPARVDLALLSVCFYVFVDILSVVLVEQFWSLANSLHDTDEGRRWYGFIGTGGLVGGAFGGGIASMLLMHTRLDTFDLLVVGASVLLLVAGLNGWMAWAGYYEERVEGRVKHSPDPSPDGSLAHRGGAEPLGSYLWLVAGLLLLAQLVEPVIEYQLARGVEEAFAERDERTAFLSSLFMWLSAVAIAVNLLLTPLVHRYLGVVAGLASQPVVLLCAALGYAWQPDLITCSTMKIADRGLSYSINRASKELLYIFIEPVLLYRAKAWIDMFGYRAFKVLGALLILLLSQPGSPLAVEYPQLTPITLLVCGLWIALVWHVGRRYRRLNEGYESPLQVAPGTSA